MKKFDTAHLVNARYGHRSGGRCKSLLVLLMTFVSAFGQTTVWIDGTGVWFIPENWSAGVPD